MKCPEGYTPGCSCSIQGLEPNEDCHIHGWPDPRRCAYCDAFVSQDNPCKRCGCDYYVRYPLKAMPL
jgi:hypothetical protein